MFRLDNKTALITGGGSGIGKAMALLFAKQGATVHIIELSTQNAKQTVDEIIAAGGKAYAHHCNVANQQEIVDTVSNNIETLDILINNAGIAHVGKASNTSEADFDKVMAVNVKGAYNCIYASIPKLLVKGGVIINMASIGSNVGIADRFVYSTSKGAIKAMTMSVARDYLKEKIRCNSISPARVHTPFVDGFLKKSYPGLEAEMFEKLSKSQPIGRMAQPHEIATLALYLCSDEAGFITGCDYPIDGGFTTLNN
jgi:NAD(P)-dependent dehydrogenase (short-subunit alcohol dehydrogenase family)